MDTSCAVDDKETDAPDTLSRPSADKPTPAVADIETSLAVMRMAPVPVRSSDWAAEIETSATVEEMATPEAPVTDAWPRSDVSIRFDAAVTEMSFSDAFAVIPCSLTSSIVEQVLITSTLPLLAVKFTP